MTLVLDVRRRTSFHVQASGSRRQALRLDTAVKFRSNEKAGFNLRLVGFHTRTSKGFGVVIQMPERVQICGALIRVLYLREGRIGGLGLDSIAGSNSYE